MNDGLRTDVFVRYLPEAIACACIYLASCKLGIPLPRHPMWWEMFSVDEDSVHEIALTLVRLYARPKPNIVALEKDLAKLRKQQLETRERELELKKQSQTGVSKGAVSDNVAAVSPPAVADNLNDPSLPADSVVNKTKKPIDSNDPNRVIASAVATARAAAANISATRNNSSSALIEEVLRANRDASSSDLSKRLTNGSIDKFNSANYGSTELDSKRVDR